MEIAVYMQNKYIPSSTDWILYCFVFSINQTFLQIQIHDKRNESALVSNRQIKDIIRANVYAILSSIQLFLNAEISFKITIVLQSAFISSPEVSYDTLYMSEQRK